MTVFLVANVCNSHYLKLVRRKINVSLSYIFNMFSSGPIHRNHVAN